MFLNSVGNVITHGMTSNILFSLFGLIYRPNYNLRSRVSTKLVEIQASKSIPFQLGETECVAVHIRRGDRIQNFTIPTGEFCNLYRKHGLERYNCSVKAMADINAMIPKELGLPILTDCAVFSNSGCFAVHPFGDLTLINYLDRAKLVVPSARAAFIMTDDGPWLEQQMQALVGSKSPFADWQIGVLPAAPDSRSLKNGTRSTVDFWASVAAARQCSGFVGHFGSGIANFVYQAMCFQYRDYTGVCPPASDIGEN